MRGPIMAHFKQAGHGFELPGAKTSATTVSGHEISMFRSKQLPDGVMGGGLNLVLMGTDIEEEIRAKYRAFGQKPKELRVVATFKRYGREYNLTPGLDWAVLESRAQEDGISPVGPNMVIATEHPYTIMEKVSGLFHPVKIGDEGSPLGLQDFREWMRDQNESISREPGEAGKKRVVGIYIVDGKIPSILERGMADVGTIVTESGKTNRDNQLITERIKPIGMKLYGRKEFVEGNEQVAEFARTLIEAHQEGRREYLLRRRELGISESVLIDPSIQPQSEAIEPMGRRL